MGEEAFADFRRAINDPATVHAHEADPRGLPDSSGRGIGSSGGAAGCHPPRVGLGWPGAVSIARALTQPDQADSMRRSNKFLLRPTGRQAGSLAGCLEDHRQLYNGALKHRRSAWRMGGFVSCSAFRH
jgi:hypothetical protein